MDPKTFKIPEANLSALQARIAKLSKKAEKLNTEPITLKILGTITEPDKEIKGLVHKFFMVIVTGPEPRVNGYKFVGALDVINIDGQKMAVVRTAPGETVPTDLRERVQDCDHCHTTRARKTLYVLRKEA